MEFSIRIAADLPVADALFFQPGNRGHVDAERDDIYFEVIG